VVKNDIVKLFDTIKSYGMLSNIRSRDKNEWANGSFLDFVVG
jgi:hypothetical protein